MEKNDWKVPYIYLLKREEFPISGLSLWPGDQQGRSILSKTLTLTFSDYQKTS